VLVPVLSLIKTSGDSSELSSAVALLLQFLRTCPAQQLLQCAAGGSLGSEEAGLKALLSAVRQLVAPTQQDAAVKLAGPLMAQLLKAMPQQMCGPIPAAAAAASNGGAAAGPAGSCVGVLLHDTVAQMAAGTCSPTTLSHLLEFVVRLVMLPAIGAQGVVELLANMNLHKQGETALLRQEQNLELASVCATLRLYCYTSCSGCIQRCCTYPVTQSVEWKAVAKKLLQCNSSS
jgi:hypothetical protein